MPLLRDEEGASQESTRITRLRKHFAADVTASWADIILILLSFITGLLDSAVFNVWSCFVSMMTGNTIYAGLGVSGQPKDQPWRWAKSIVAIVAFMLGSLMFTTLMRYLGSMRRNTIVLAFSLQAVLIFVSAALTTFGVVSPDAGYLLPDNFIVLLPLALLSIQSGGQMILSRILGYGEVTSVVLTSAYCDLVMDEKLLAPLKENSKRNRRVMSTIMVVAGAISGGFLTVGGDISSALWLAGGLKTILAVVWCFWKAEGSIRLE